VDVTHAAPGLAPGPARRRATRAAAAPLPAGPGPPAGSSFLRAVLEGLAARPRAIPSVWLYDERGSRLFRRISRLDAYYLTRCEREILSRHADEIVAPLAGRPCTVADLGAGDGGKTRLLLARLLARSPRVTYAPVDVSPAALSGACARTARELPAVGLRPVEAEYGTGLRRLRSGARDGAVLALLLGSNLGNLEHAEALALLREVRATLRPGDHLLLGLDLLKGRGVLRAAYDDREGVTAAFNLNLLRRMRRELGAEVDPAGFEHRATFDPVRPAMESWLVSRRRQAVRVAGRTFVLAAGEAVHVEISCKYHEEDAGALAAASGFEEAGRFRDRRGWFLDALWRVPGRARARGGEG
jgi:dimethylhistidine N-methyltransferase